jgi:hypothetical protein
MPHLPYQADHIVTEVEVGEMVEGGEEESAPLCGGGKYGGVPLRECGGRNTNVPGMRRARVKSCDDIL